MPAGLTDQDSMFSVREPAWHGLGHLLTEYPTRQQAQELAHPWEPEQVPLYRRVLIEHASGPPSEGYEPVPDVKLNIRNDTGAPLGVVGDGYNLVTNGTLWDIAEALEETEDDVMFETAGSLQGGRRVWVLLRLREPLVLPGDRSATVPHYALQNYHDGGGKFRGQATIVRIVCMNTSQAADMDARIRGTEFEFRHTKSVHERIEEARDALKGWRLSIQDWRLFNESLLNVPISPMNREFFIERFIPMPPPHMVSDRVVTNVNTARGTLRSILMGQTCEGIENTAYGLVQSAIEYQNHYRAARTDESRFKRAYLTRSQVINDAVTLAIEAGR